MSTAKIRIKAGDVELDYEGEAGFLKSDLLKLFRDLQGPSFETGHSRPAQPKNSPAGGQLTTKSIATKLNAKSGSDLARAAIAHLVLMKGQAQVKRSEILTEMKTATGVYKANMASNLTKIISKLLNDQTVVENSAGVYALTPTAETKLKGQVQGGQ